MREFNYFECKDSTGNSIDKEEWKSIHERFSEPRYLWLIQPFPGAIEGLRQLSKHCTLHFATSRLPKARRVTVEWLENHGFPSHDLHFLRHGEKHVSLRQLSAAVEDNYDQAKAFATDGGIPCFLLRHPWNRTKPAVDGIHWADNWAELTEHLLRIA
ncbi:MAG: 5' nucleotidase, NT5C type [Burkholderiales bacterium]